MYIMFFPFFLILKPIVKFGSANIPAFVNFCFIDHTEYFVDSLNERRRERRREKE